MDIAIFSANYLPNIGGIENYTKNLAEALVRQGCRVTIVTNNCFDLSEQENLDSGIEIIRLPCSSLINGRLPIPKRNRAYKKLVTMLLQENFDAVFINGRYYAHSILGVRVARAVGAKAVVIDHSSGYITLGNSILNAVSRMYEHSMTFYLKSFRPLFCSVSKKGSDWLKTFGITTSTILPNSISVPLFQAEAAQRSFLDELGIHPETTLVCFCGRLVEGKGVLETVEGVCGARRLGADVQLVVAGSGPLADDLQGMKKEWLHFLGPLDHSSVSALLRDSDIFCFPSSYPEGLPTAVLEAMAQNCAVIMTPVGGVDELIPNDSCGVVLTDMGFSDMGRQIYTLATDPARIRAYCDNALINISRNLSWEKTAERCLELVAPD